MPGIRLACREDADFLLLKLCLGVGLEDLLLSRFVLVCHDGVQPLLSLLYDGFFLVLEKSFAFFQVADGYQCRKIRLIESNVKCNYPKKLTCKRTLRQVFLSIFEAPSPPLTQCPPSLHTVYVYTV
jgi:hypothetical protein